VEGFTRSYREAMHARRIAELTRRRPGSVFAYEDVALVALASSDLEHARDFVLRQLGPLMADDDATVRVAATLRVYLEEGSRPRRAAERLGVHPNTIAYRIQAAEEMLGYPIESRVAELLVALRLAPVVRDDRRLSPIRRSAHTRDNPAGRLVNSAQATPAELEGRTST